MDDEQYHRLVLEMSVAAMQEFGRHAGEYPERSGEWAAYRILESNADKLFHAAWERVMRHD